MWYLYIFLSLKGALIAFRSSTWRYMSVAWGPLQWYLKCLRKQSTVGMKTITGTSSHAVCPQFGSPHAVQCLMIALSDCIWLLVVHPFQFWSIYKGAVVFCFSSTDFSRSKASGRAGAKKNTSHTEHERGHWLFTSEPRGTHTRTQHAIAKTT